MIKLKYSFSVVHICGTMDIKTVSFSVALESTRQSPDLCIAPAMMLRPVILRYNSAIHICLMHCPQTALSLDLKACTKGDFVMPTGRSHQSSFLPENRLYFSFELSCLSFPDIVFVQVFTTRLIRPVIPAIFSL